MDETVIGMHEAKSTLSQLVQRAAAGETILIGPHGRAQAKLVPVDVAPARKRIGVARGKFKVPDNIDEHNEEVANLFLVSNR
ncbi:MULTISPECIES: type II toxin-antitoxin system prevent-host-death family antitoxin [Ramlibacter]|uniref:Type II toxin-antitoxin system prevent-host-death family antitoxin n=1 Tax=Ramlibacter aquaticus TaxID=2780094 RepID=A0ABR9SJ37_9BURK|nr:MULTISPECIES: type II toxin-antitoxin system prevent-host-death family antitoxin [Ramlibacter]MBE7942360.1 type II toxin-antitoxin system prevent-host-death family antitoxin [Ramlibacter aquaticus]